MKVTIVSGAKGSGKTTFINQLIETENIEIPILREYPEIDETYRDSVFESLEDVDAQGHLFIESQDIESLCFDYNEREFYDTTLRLFRTWIDVDGSFKVYKIEDELPF